MSKLIPFALLLLLAGCAAKPMEVSKIASIKPTNGAKGVDIYEKRRRAGEKVPEFAGDQIVPVRTYAATEHGHRGQEFGGAKCLVQARDFKATVTTPAKVRLPVYRAQSSPLSVSCKHPEYKPKVADQGVFNKTQSDRLNAGSSAGLAGLVVMAAVNGLANSRGDDYLYPPVQVVMTPLTAKKRKN